MVFGVLYGLTWWRLKPHFLRLPADSNTALGPAKGLHQIQLMGASVIGGLCGWVVMGPWAALLGFLVGLVVVKGLYFQAQQKQNKQLIQQLPLFLRALGSTLKAGYSVPQALQFVALEVQAPLQNKLAPGVQALQLQQPLEVVLQSWRQAINQAEWHFLTDSLQMQASSGGDLVSLCHKVATLLEERLKLEQDLKSFTAQGKMSGYLMAGLWPVSLLLFAWLAPAHTEVLFNTTAGNILLGLSLGLEAVGFLLIWRIVRVKI